MIRHLTITLLLSLLSQLSYGQDESFNCDSIPTSMSQRFTKQFPTDEIIQCEILFPEKYFGIYHKIDSNITLYTTIDENHLITSQAIAVNDIPFNIYREIAKEYPKSFFSPDSYLLDIEAAFVVENDTAIYYQICWSFGDSIENEDGITTYESFGSCAFFDLEGNECKSNRW